MEIIMLLVVEVFSLFLHRFFCENTLTVRENRKKLEWGVWGAYFLVFNATTYIFINQFQIPWLNLLIFVITFFVAIRTLYIDSTRTLIAVTAFMYLSGMGSELFVFYGIALLPGNYGEHTDLLCTIMSKLVWFFLLKLVSLLVKVNKKVELNIQDWLEMFIVPIGSIGILLGLFYQGEIEDDCFDFLVVAVILVINIFTYYLYDKARETMEKRLREELLEQQCDYYILQSRKNAEWWESLRQYRHDMKQRFLLEKAYIEAKDYVALEKFCNDNLNFLDSKKHISDTGNLYVDSIINFKADKVEKMGITFVCDLNVPQDTEINAEDLCVCLGNLIDNAIEATEGLDGDKQIYVKIHVDKRNLFINIINKYKGVRKKNENGYVTNKTDSRKHGYGLLSVRHIVEKYDGEMNIQDCNNEFDVEILLYEFVK